MRKLSDLHIEHLLHKHRSNAKPQAPPMAHVRPGSGRGGKPLGLPPFVERGQIGCGAGCAGANYLSCSCQRYFTERLEFVDWERRYTQRYEEHIYQRVKSSSIEQVRREEQLSFEQVQGIFNHKHSPKKNSLGGRSKTFEH